MPKKSRRAKAKQRARMTKSAEERHPQQSVPTPATMPTPTKPQSPTRVSPRIQVPKVRDLASRYQYVIPEVKRIGIVAGSIILILIILSFVLG